MNSKGESEFFLKSDDYFSGTVTIRTDPLHKDLFYFLKKIDTTTEGVPTEATTLNMPYTDTTTVHNDRTYTITNTNYFIFFTTFDLTNVTVLKHRDTVTAEIIIDMHPVNDQTTALDLVTIDDESVNDNTINITASVIRDLSNYGDTYTGRIFANDAVLNANSLHLGTGILSMDAMSNSLMFEPSGTKKYRLARANQIDDGGLQPNTIVRVEPSGEINILVKQNTSDPKSVLHVSTAGEVTIRNGIIFANNSTDENALKWKLEMNSNGHEMYLMKRNNTNDDWDIINTWM